jgi:site-specific DNA-cytosine methylase
MFNLTEEKLLSTMISLFTGAMGLDLGFEVEGFETRVIVENDCAAVDTCASSAFKAQLCNGHFNRLNYACQAPSISGCALLLFSDIPDL